MSGRSSQRKGRAAELELCRILQERGYSVRLGAPQSFGQEPDLCGLDGIHVEVKRREAADLTGWLRQAAKDAERFRDGLPCVFWRHNRGMWTASMTLAGWLELYERQKSAESGKEVTR